MGRLSLLVAAAAGSGVSAACGGRSSLELSWDQDAAIADVSVPPLGQDGAIDSAATDDGLSITETPPSCQAGGPGLTNCEANSESCCTSLEVPGGTFYRTYTYYDDSPIDEADPATVSGFRLDKYLVTVGRFRQFVAAWNAGWLPAAGSGKHTFLNGGNGLNAPGGGYEPGWVPTDNGNIAPTNANLACYNFPTWTNTAGTEENLPINCVNWYEAFAFCIWDGGFLPSEAEWGYAAAGGSEQREYPWGSTDPGRGFQYAIYDCYYPYPSGSNCGGAVSVASIAPVGTAIAGAGLWGQLDMAGEVGEWNLDGYALYANPCTDCADFTDALYRVYRGGNFDYLTAPVDLRGSSRSQGDPSGSVSFIGFRCARTP
jgi:formylglycine-generating enzyme required for sulfatase activity